MSTGRMPRGRWWGRGGAVAVTASMVVMLAACSNASSAPPSGGAQAPGVTSTEIKVGALATITGPLSSGFGDIVHGVEAYFDMVNAQGGVDGRKLVLADVANDGGSPTNDTTEARDLVEQDHVFAIVGVGTPFFTASTYLASTGTPTFGYVVSSNWQGPPNLFGTYGSVLAFNTGGSAIEWAAHQLGVHTAAVVAYNGIAQSDDACRDDAQGLERAGISVPVQDYTFDLGGNPDADVFRMAADHVGLLVTCMEGPDNLSFAKAMKQYGLSSAYSIWLNGYSRTLAAQDATAMQRVIFSVQHVPFEAGEAYPSQYPGMATYLKEMKKYQPAWVYDDVSFQGWVNAAQFVAGLRAVGNKPLTQKALVDAINEETDFTAGGVMPPVNWHVAHTSAQPPYCSAFAQVVNGKVVLNAALMLRGHQALVCFNGVTDVPVADPPGTPGA